MTSSSAAAAITGADLVERAVTSSSIDGRGDHRRRHLDRVTWTAIKMQNCILIRQQ